MLDRLIEDCAHIVMIHPDLPADQGGILAYHFGSDIGAAQQWACDWNASGYNAYWTVNEVRAGLHRKPGKVDITRARFVHVDVDPPFEKDQKLREMLTASVPPTVIIDSGNGIQALWRLADAPALLEVEAVNRRLAETFGGDNCHNIDRLLRVPGTTNYPSPVKRERGYTCTKAGLLFC